MKELNALRRLFQDGQAAGCMALHVSCELCEVARAHDPASGGRLSEGQRTRMRTLEGIGGQARAH
jgi:hypothetical protein